jgi:hypothetical protein
MTSELQQIAEATAWLAVVFWVGLALLIGGVVVELIERIRK